MRRAGTQSLPLGELGAVEPGKWLSVCSLVEDKAPKARTVRIQVARTETVEALYHERLPAGVWWGHHDSAPWIGAGSDAQCGALRFRYGSVGVQRMLITDLASGEYQIPACEYLTVEAVRFTPSTDEARLIELGYAGDIEVAGEIVDGAIADFSPMQVTALSPWASSEFPDVDRASVVAVPPGAYAFELFPDFPVATDNAFEVSIPAAIRSFADGTQQPPTSPLPVVSPFVRVQCRGQYPQPCRIVFYVR